MNGLLPTRPAMEWWKFDYTGADAWTVAGRCAQLGDDTMLLDLQAGLRIPTLLGLVLEGVTLSRFDRPALAAMCASFKRDWRDIAFKRAVYGSAYGMSPKGIRRVAVADSFRETGEPRDPGLQLCARIQTAMLSRYWGIAHWHRWVASQVKATGKLTAASGLTREFFGRRVIAGQLDESTHREALAFEPQANTTYCLNRAVDALWTDAENRDRSDHGFCLRCHEPWEEHPDPQRTCEQWTGELAGEPIIQVLLVVHDEASGQAPASRRDWVRAKVRAAMAQHLQFGKVAVTVPAELKFGPNWGQCKDD